MCQLKLIMTGTQKFLIFGKTGWIGGLLADLLKEMGAEFEMANARLEDRAAVIADLDRVTFQSHSHAFVQALPTCIYAMAFGIIK